MALRYQLPTFSTPVEPKDNLTRPYVMRPPETFEFRKGADIDVLVNEILPYQSIKLDAAVGAGKSTLFPSVLARISKGLVIHVVPNPMLAVDLFQYVVKQKENSPIPGVPLELWSSVDQQVPRTGVLFMSSADLIALILHRGFLDQYGDVNVFMDEAHESDAYTYLVRNFAINFGAVKIVQASATFGPVGTRQRETPADLTSSNFPPELTPDKWDVEDIKKPWCWCGLNNNLLIFVDIKAHVNHLAQAYSDCGLIVHKLEANMPQEKFVKAMADLRDVKGPMVVLLADYSFRSGFTFDVDRIIDTGNVTYFDHHPGTVEKKSRIMCQFESEQAAGRAGRVRAGKVEYFSPEASYPAEICDLEGVEREAAAYLLRCFGLKPIGPLAATIMAHENLPSSVPAKVALNGLYPLTFYVVDSNGKIRSPSPADESRRQSVAAESLSGSDTVYSDSVADKPKFVDDDDYKEFIRSLDNLHSGMRLEEGMYYRVPGIKVKEEPTLAFPAGLQSVRKFMLHSEGIAVGLSTKDLKYAISIALSRYNLLNVEIQAITKFLQDSIREKPFSKVGVKQMMVSVFEEMGKIKAERSEMLSIVNDLTRDKYSVKQFSGLDSLVQDRVGHYEQRLDELDDDGSEGYLEELQAAPNIDTGLMTGNLQLKPLTWESKSSVDGRYGENTVNHGRHGKKTLILPSRFSLKPDKEVSLKKRRDGSFSGRDEKYRYTYIPNSEEYSKVRCLHGHDKANTSCRVQSDCKLWFGK